MYPCTLQPNYKQFPDAIIRLLKMYSGQIKAKITSLQLSSKTLISTLAFTYWFWLFFKLFSNDKKMYSWSATTWQGSHAGGQYNRYISQRIYLKIELPRWEKCVLFLTTNLCAITSVRTSNIIAANLHSNRILKPWKITTLKIPRKHTNW